MARTKCTKLLEPLTGDRVQTNQYSFCRALRVHPALTHVGGPITDLGRRRRTLVSPRLQGRGDGPHGQDKRTDPQQPRCVATAWSGLAAGVDLPGAVPCGPSCVQVRGRVCDTQGGKEAPMVTSFLLAGPGGGRRIPSAWPWILTRHHLEETGSARGG